MSKPNLKREKSAKHSLLERFFPRNSTKNVLQFRIETILNHSVSTFCVCVCENESGGL